MATHHLTTGVVTEFEVTPAERAEILTFVDRRLDTAYERIREIADAENQAMRDELRSLIDLIDQLHQADERIVITRGLDDLADLLGGARRYALDIIDDESRAVRRARTGDTGWMIDGDLAVTEDNYRVVVDRELDEVVVCDRLLERLAGRSASQEV